MARVSTAEPVNTRLFVLALGLLVGFVIGFIMLLAYIPVEDGLGDFHTAGVDNQAAGEQRKFEFYSVLADKLGQSGRAQAGAGRSQNGVLTASPPQAAVTPATRVVPGNAQSLSQRSLAAEDYAVIPATSLGQESYYLQAGSFRAPDDAERMRATVLLLGLEAFIVTRQDASGAMGHRVRIGPFFDQNRLTEAKQRLRRGNVTYDIVRVTG
jgi:cell division protein FtsN